MLHGRTLPAASAAKTANPELTVIAVGGDGDGYAEGGNHFIHTLRRNHDITYLVHNNQVYGLTKGQASPTSEKGFVTKTSLEGAWSPMNPIIMAVAGGASFVARGFAGDADHLAGIIKAGIEHKGLALIDILQPCVSFNHLNTYAWYRERVYNIGETNYDPSDKVDAFQKAQEWGEKIPIGIIYRKEVLTFEEQFSVLNNGPLAKQDIKPMRVKTLLDEFM
jgi:2-oxoglutarate ferredoxin oxidoreductase subunit beta